MVFFQTILAFLVILLVLIQSRGAGIGTAWGGGGEFYGTRRGIEKLFFRLTVVATILFTIASLVQVLKF